MKKLGLLIVLMALMCSCVYVPNEEEHFIDEKFVLVNKTEKEMVVDGDTRNVRKWEIQRVITVGDSLEIGEITDNEDGCGCGILTEELWYSKEIGDVLYFEFIRKDRFHKIPTLGTIWGEEESTTTPRSVTPEDVRAETSKNMSEMEADLRALEIEREIMALEREKESLNRK